MADAHEPVVRLAKHDKHNGKDLGGRPRKAWNSNRRAQAVALHFWTTLSMEDKLKCLHDSDFIFK